jgi:arsenite methyltransferase
MHIKWANIFLDPETREAFSLDIKKREGNEVFEGAFISPEKKIYPVIKGIPRFVSDEFYNKITGELASDAVQTGRSFGDKWQAEACKSLGYTEAERELFQEIFLSLLGCSTLEDIFKIFEKAETCLDAGCGIGWADDLFNVNTRTKRVAVDISLSVEVAYERLKNIPNVLIAQADIFNLPFSEEYFDIIFSNGVIHHTPNPKEAFSILCKYLKPKGLIGVYIYNVKPFLREIADKEIRKLTTQMSFDNCYNFSRQIAALGKALQQIDQPLIVEEDIPLLNINKGQHNLQKFIYDHFLKCFYNKKLGDEISEVTNVDWYHPKYASHHTREEIQGWFDENDIENVRFIQPPGWEHSGYFVSGNKAK